MQFSVEGHHVRAVQAISAHPQDATEPAAVVKGRRKYLCQRPQRRLAVIAILPPAPTATTTQPRLLHRCSRGSQVWLAPGFARNGSQNSAARAYPVERSVAAIRAASAATRADDSAQDSGGFSSCPGIACVPRLPNVARSLPNSRSALTSSAQPQQSSAAGDPVPLVYRDPCGDRCLGSCACSAHIVAARRTHPSASILRRAEAAPADARKRHSAGGVAPGRRHAAPRSAGASAAGSGIRPLFYRDHAPASASASSISVRTFIRC